MNNTLEKKLNEYKEDLKELHNDSLLEDLLVYFKEEIEKTGGLFLWAEYTNMDIIQVI